MTPIRPSARNPEVATTAGGTSATEYQHNGSSLDRIPHTVADARAEVAMDDMSRLNRIEDFWNWLPAFRAVAATEHVGEASEKVHKSPSALSRAVGLLEEDFGVELFESTGRQIQLTEAGRDFLKIVRKSMRLVDEGMRRVAEADPVRQFHLGSSRRLGWALESTLGRLTGTLDGTDLHVSTSEEPAPREHILRGKLDLLITHQPVEGDQIETRHVADLENLLCGPGDHPLMHTDEIDDEDLEQTEFVAPPNEGTDRPADGWPPGRERRVVCRVERPRTAARLAAEGGHLAILPRQFAASERDSAFELLARASSALADTPVYAVRRQQLVDDDLAGEILDRLVGAFPVRTERRGAAAGAAG